MPILDRAHLTCLTWNIALAKPSNCAPSSWQIGRSQRQREALLKEILDANADVLALQEVPYPEWEDEFLLNHGYVRIGSTQSHCGWVLLLLRIELTFLVQKHVCIGPTVLAKLQTSAEDVLWLSSSHLAPFKDNAGLRLRQLQAVVQYCEQQKDSAWILCGDLNLRKEENISVEQSPRQGTLLDAWKAAGAPRHTKYTWNSKKNLFHPKTFGFVARFDRVYFYSDTLKVQTFALLANKPLSHNAHFISDHFGIVTTFTTNASNEHTCQ